MPSTHHLSSDATAAITPPIIPHALVDALAAVRDPRSRQGRRFTVAALLTLAVAAMLANHLSPFAIAQWGAEQEAASKRARGFPKGVTPHQSTFARLFRRLDPAVLSAALTALGVEHRSSDGRLRGAVGVAIDGKAQRGRLAFAVTAGCPVHALTACTHERGVVLAQEEIVSDAEKAEAELSVAPRLIAHLDWRGRVLTGDALFCQRNLCAGGRRRGRLPRDRQGEPAAPPVRHRPPLRFACGRLPACGELARVGHARGDERGARAWAA